MMQTPTEQAPEGATDPQVQAAADAPAPAPAQPTAAPLIDVPRAVELLREGGLVAFPTETVYGLGADAANAEALARLYKVKGRPKSHPLIVHIADASQLDAWAVDIPDAARHLARVFWPGPLTLVLKRASHVSDAVTGGQDTVALRVPSHPLALQLLDAFCGMPEGVDSPEEGGQPASSVPRGVAAPSANRYARLSPTTAEHVRHDLGADIDGVVDGGACEVGLESTIVDCSRRELGPVILRPGRISAADIERELGEPLARPQDPEGGAPRVPGTHALHYAPRAKLRLATRREIIDLLVANRGRRIAVLALEVPVARLPTGQSVVVPAVAAQYARALYANLRLLDATGADLILVERPPATPSWTAIHDRLRRAATEAPAVKSADKDADRDGAAGVPQDVERDAEKDAA